ncbi:hypothetical protein EXN66_Car003438 [Channa argus]|uniref:Uncharacterized protein n=1 Tax=Channa argus TaxID=215402 RepID=A0A6G1PCL1_CHAAH|nr:hypothetical protein EXN66_Car003438 [Channa argus]
MLRALVSSYSAASRETQQRVGGEPWDEPREEHSPQGFTSPSSSLTPFIAPQGRPLHRKEKYFMMEM